ncbi:hypothetical protein [Amycolatopsis minnesotensis]|uniref:Uncharacterized protein n=1 Tax=Amycolatopsis minnesotensis TaxID=337894 RepID=A0ABN2RMQ2_9PSEU
MTGLFPEYQETSITEPLRQGDVLEATAPGASFWERHLLVLTADCDLARGKHRGRVTCVPLLTAPEYLLEMKVPVLRERAQSKFVAELRKVLPPEAPNISDERLKLWPCEAEPAEIISALGLDGKAAGATKAALESIRLVSNETLSLDEAIDALIESQATAPNAPKRQTIVNKVLDALRSPYSSPPGDALFLSSIAPENTFGYFAYLRHLEQIEESDIAIGPSRTATSYRRIARLRDRYTHALVQQFALVFMSIGLPPAYEEMRALHSEFMGENYL